MYTTFCTYKIIIQKCTYQIYLQQGLLEEINARRRERFYRTRQAISYYWTRVVDRRQCILNRMNRIQTDVRHRSLIRIAGSYLPLKPLKRIRIQVCY